MGLREDLVVVDMAATETDRAVLNLAEGLGRRWHNMERGDRLRCDQEQFI